jgi:GNAT superfamily N-acetyltransferase
MKPAGRTQMPPLHKPAMRLRWKTIRTLFREYQEALGIDLSFQDFETELQTLPGDYAPPRGRLLLADGLPAGCVAMRPLAGDTYEMKRLYVRPPFRKTGLGRELAERILLEARAAGYRRMCLDTLPAMTGAQRLYEILGFREIPPYRHNPIEGTRFLGIDL